MFRKAIVQGYRPLTAHGAWTIRTSVRPASFFGSSTKVTEWNKAVSEAERIVGYPTSFMSLRCLLSDELSNVALQMRKLVGTKHPLMKTARRFVYDGKHSLQMRGLLVLLLSKAAGPSGEARDNIAETMVSGIYPSQRSLAEITEMIHTAYLVHKGVVNLSSLQPADGAVQDMEFGNKMAVLSGDFLLANASTALAELYNTEVVELISSAIRDFTAAEFSKLKDANGDPVWPTYGATITDWEQQTFLASGSLLAKSCKSAMMLAQHPLDIQDRAYRFGDHTAKAHQLQEDLRPFVQSGADNGNGISVTSAPVILHVSSHPDDQTRLLALLDRSPSHHDQVCRMLRDSSAVEQAQSLCQHHAELALQNLSTFPQSDARIAVENIIKATTSAS